MRLKALILPLLLASAPAAAAPDWRQAREVELLLSSFDIKPETIRLRAGQPVRLRLVNQSSQRHSLSAKGFFTSAEARKRDSDEIGDGDVTVEPGDTKEVVLVPKAGRYSVRSSNLLYRIMGMGGKIIVE
jgi:uncharacterized cupredoxin-like copper-binding protein